MPYTNLIDQISTNIANIKNLDLEQALAGKYVPWNNLNIEDLKNSLDDFMTIMDGSIEQNVLLEFTHNILNSLNSGINSLFQNLNNFSNQRNQAGFQNSLAQLESNRTNLYTWGIPAHLNYGKQIRESIDGFNQEYQKIINKKVEVETLAANVKSLIEPAVAGSLSSAFSRRQDKLATKQWIWLALTVISGIASLWSTIYVVNSLVELYNPEIPLNATVEQITSILNREIPKTIIAFLRIGILIPAYGLFVYFFRQYNKERNLEEEYAHRAAVASSLPNYGNLAGDPKVKDQIVSSASDVVFTSPIESRKKSSSSSKNVSFDQVNKLIEQLTKFKLPGGE